MKITNDMINPQLRTRGKMIRCILPYFKQSTFIKINKLMRFMRSKPDKQLQFEQVFIKRKDGSSLRLCIYRPQVMQENATGLLWVHGGGYAIGRPEQDVTFIKDFILKYNCVVIAPDYTLSTEDPYPSALDDCYLALLWLKQHAAENMIRSDQLMVGGDSAGGGLTAALTIYARDQKEVSIAFQMPLYPMLDDRVTITSQNNDAPVWNTKSNEIAWKMYLGSLYGSDDIPVYAAPARLTNFENLPPAFTYIGSIDPFLNETLSYMENLKSAGIPAEYIIFDGCYHAFDVIVPKSTPAKEAKEHLLKAFAHAQSHYFAPQPN